MIQGLGERLQKARTNLKISQKEAAVALGVSPAIISNYENSERTPSAENLMALANLYQCSADYLLGLDAEKLVVDTSMLTPAQTQLLQQFLYGLKNSQ